MFTEPAFLLAFVAEELRKREPFDGLFVTSLMCRNHTGQRWSHFGAQRNFAIPFVFKVIELTDDFGAALGGVKFERFEWRAVIFAKAITAGHVAPLIENVLAGVGAPHVRMWERFGIEVPESGQAVHQGCGAGVLEESFSTAARISLPALNFTTVRSGIGTSVEGAFGFLPMRARRVRISKTPKLRNSIFCPLASAVVMPSSVF